MNQYTLDYSSPYPNGRPPNRRSRRKMNRTLRQTVLLLCALAFGIAFVAAIQMRADAQFHRVQFQHQAVRYDSLLAAKAEADRQLQQLRNLATQTSPKP